MSIGDLIISTMKDTYKDVLLPDEKIVLASIKALINERGISPSVEEIRVHAGMSFGTTHKQIERLEYKKEIKRTYDANGNPVYRSIQIVKRSRKKSAA